MEGQKTITTNKNIKTTKQNKENTTAKKKQKKGKFRKTQQKNRKTPKAMGKYKREKNQCIRRIPTKWKRTDKRK